VAGIFLQASSTLLPVLIVGLVGSSANAYFYIPFTIVTAFDLLFVNVTSSLTVEGAMAESRFPVLAWNIVRRFGVLLLAGAAVLIIGAPLLLFPFGHAYVVAGTPVLRLLASASAFRAVSAVFVVKCRIEGRAFRILALQASTFAMVIGLTIVLARAHGIDGVAVAWLIANGIAGSCVAGPVLRTVASGRQLSRMGWSAA